MTSWMDCVFAVSGLFDFLLSAVSVHDQKDKMQVQQNNIEEAVYVQDQQAPHITSKGYPPNERSLS